MTRLRVEVGLTNALGALVLVLGAVLFDPPAREGAGPASGAAWSLLLVLPAITAGVWASNRLVRPLVAWLRSGVAGRPAPDDVQRLVLAHPALQATILLALWLATAVALGVVDVVAGSEEPVRELVTTTLGVATAGVVVSTLSFLADQRVLGPWYERFFAGEDPTRHAVPSTRVRRRLIVAFLLGTAVPLALTGAVVSERLAHPEGVGQLEGIVWFLVGVGVLTGLTVMLSVRQSIIRPLDQIRWAANRVREGELAVSVPVESPDEFGQVAVAFNAMVEGLRERRRLEDLFGRQVGESVARRALEAGVDLGGERRRATVLFIDLAGFSHIGEELAPEEVVDLLNRVFEVVVGEVSEREGLVNKFMGDAVLAVFGAPLADPDHASHALDAAGAIAGRLAAEGFRFGIGVSTGPVIAGNVGSEERYEYTVVGDAVNEAARLQEAARERGVGVLVSGRTVEAVGARDGLVHRGTEQLRGRSRPTEVFALAE